MGESIQIKKVHSVYITLWTLHLRKEGDSNPRYEKFVRQFSKLLVSATHPSFQSSLPNRQALSLKCGCKVSHLFSSRQIYRNLFSKNLSLCSFLLIYLALSALFSTKSHHPPLSSQDHEATQTSSAARAREGLPKCAFCFITRLQNFLPEETHFLFSEQAQREAGEDERERAVTGVTRATHCPKRLRQSFTAEISTRWLTMA